MTAPVEVRIFPPDASGTGVLVPRRQGVQASEENNGVGTGRVSIHLDDALLGTNPEVLDPFSIVKVKPTGAAAWATAWQVEDIDPVQLTADENAGRLVTLAGRQVRSILDLGRVIGEGDKRNFGFSALDLPGYPGDWDTPVGVTWAYEATARANSPADWPDPTAMWLWSSNPEISAPAERNWFRAEFTLASDTNIVVLASCDNSMSLHVDGVERITTDAADLFAWRQSYSYKATLPAGEHSIAAWVDNAAATALNPGGFLCLVAEADDQGAPGTVLLRTNDTDWVCRPASNPPGWFPGAVLDLLLTEAQTAGDLPEAMTWDFTPTLDSNGDPYTRVIDEQIPVGEDLLTTSDRWAGSHYDIHMTPDLVLQLFVRRGSNLSGTVTLGPLTSVLPTGRYGAIRNVYRILTDHGWIEEEDSASVAVYGRRVGTLSLGDAGTEAQARAIAQDTLTDTAWPQTTIPVAMTSAAGPQPTDAFDCGDTVEAPAFLTGTGDARVMGWSLEESEGYITWTVDLYPETS